MSEIDRDTLVSLREKVKSTVGGRHIVDFAHGWAHHQAMSWPPEGAFNRYDVENFYEAGFLRGYLKGKAEQADFLAEALNSGDGVYRP